MEAVLSYEGEGLKVVVRLRARTSTEGRKRVGC